MLGYILYCKLGSTSCCFTFINFLIHGILFCTWLSVKMDKFQVQSRGRSVAELQVSGVKMSFTKRPFDVSLSLSVHGLLLVDALQTFGPDFELLLASHKHVG